MSLKVMVEIWENVPGKVSDGALLTALALADCTDENGRACPSKRILATKTGKSRSAIKRALRELEEAGLLARIPQTKYNGGSAVNLYRLAVDVNRHRRRSCYEP